MLCEAQPSSYRAGCSCDAERRLLPEAIITLSGIKTRGQRGIIREHGGLECYSANPSLKTGVGAIFE